MCILFIYVNSGHGGDGDPVLGEYRLVLASNRDEYYARPAKIAGPWDESPHVIGGKFLYVFKLSISYSVNAN